ncbi:MAG TPA: prepilin peptidase [Acidobacteriaceae bacterium]
MAVLVALLLGSFLNVCIARLPAHRSIVRPASHCPRCGAPIRPWDNVPLLSWLLLRGRCRACRARISVRYPLVELGYAALVAAALWRFGVTLEGAAAAVFCFLALGLLVMDLETMSLPDAFTLPGLALGLGWNLVAAMGRAPGAPFRAQSLALSSGAVAAGTWALLLLGVRWAYYAVRRRHGLGAGDVKLAAMLGAWLGFQAMAVCFLLAVLAAAAVGAAAIAWGGRRAGGWRTLRLPLGSFLCGAGIFAFFQGRQLFTWYMKFWT